MAAPFNYLNASEFVTATDLIQMGSPHYMGIISGCGVTESAANMEVTVAAGTALVAGSVVAVAGDTVTIVSDPSNLRWSIVYIDDAGDVQVANGDPAPNAETEPSKPSVNGAILKMYKVQPGQTVAANVTIAVDKGVQAHPLPYTAISSANLTKNSNTTLENVPGLAFPIGTNEVWTATFDLRTTANASGGLKFAFSVPSGATATGTRVSFAASAVAAATITDWTAESGNTAAVLAVRLTITVTNGATAGVVQLQAAQNASHASDSIVYAESSMTAWKVA